MKLPKTLYLAILLHLLCSAPIVHGQSNNFLDSLLTVASKKAADEEYKNEDAVILLQYRTVTNQYKVDSRYVMKLHYNTFSSLDHHYDKAYDTHQSYIENLYQRIKILTRKGAEEYSKVYIPKSTIGNIVTINAMTVKPDGRKIVVKREDIKEVESMTNGVFDWKQAHYRFSIPGVEVGDELEIIYSITKPDNLATTGEYFFSSYLPVIQSSLYLSFSNAIMVNLKNYNGLQSPDRGIYRNSYHFTYNKYHLAALRDVDHAILSNEMPYCRYQIISVFTPEDTSSHGTAVSLRSWNDFAIGFIALKNTTDLKGTKSKYLNKFIALHSTPGIQIPQEGFRKLLKFICDSIKVENTDVNPDYSSGYYLYNKSIPVTALDRLYTDLLSAYGIDFYYCIGMLKSQGKLDTTLISGENFSFFFFAYKDEKDSLRYLFPENSMLKFDLGEINPFSAGSTVLMMRANTPGKHEFSKLPDYSSSVNYKKRKNQIVVDLDDNVQYFDCQSVKAGTFSYLDRLSRLKITKDSVNAELRNYFKNELKNFTLDSSYNTKTDSVFPYKTTLCYKGRQKGKLTKVADSLYSVDLSEWLDHSVLPAYSDDRFVDYYPDFKYQEQFTYCYFFKVPVEVQNPSSLAGGIKNGFGSYSFLVNQVSDTVIVVQSTYKIEKDKLSFTEYDQLKQLYDQWALMKNSSFLVRVRPKLALLRSTN